MCGASVEDLRGAVFEHLVRELVDKMYAADGYTVHTTERSRDGGVDGIMFYDNLIRGGKYII